MTIRPEPVFIIAGTLSQAKATAIDHGLPDSPWTRHWIWVRDADQIRGRRDIKVILSYGALERPDWPQLRDHLDIVGVEYVE